MYLYIKRTPAIIFAILLFSLASNQKFKRIGKFFFLEHQMQLAVAVAVALLIVPIAKATDYCCEYEFTSQPLTLL